MLDFSNINYWALVVSWFICLAVGSFWYSPAGFGKLWSKLSGVDMMKIPTDEATRAIIYVAASSLLQVITLAVLLDSLKVTDVVNGIGVGLFIWAGLVAATTIGTTFYSRKSWKFWWLNASFFLVIMTINSALLSVWT